jgi:hypothetical protein
MIRIPAIEWAQHGQRDRTGHHRDPVARARCRVPKSPLRPRVRMVDVDRGKRLAQSVAVFADGTVGRRLRVAAPANRAGSSALTSAIIGEAHQCGTETAEHRSTISGMVLRKRCDACGQTTGLPRLSRARPLQNARLFDLFSSRRGDGAPHNGSRDRVLPSVRVVEKGYD